MSLFKDQREQVKIIVEETAVNLFREKGYENVTIDEITKSVGIAKGTFYNFYTSKLDILMLWAEKEFTRFNFMDAVSPIGTIEENLYSLIKMLSKAILSEEKLFRYFILEIIRVFGDEKLNDKFDFIKIFSEVIKNSKDYEKIGTALFNEKIDMLNNSLFLGIVNWFNKEKSIMRLEEYLLNITKLCLCGIIINFEEGEK